MPTFAYKGRNRLNEMVSGEKEAGSYAGSRLTPKIPAPLHDGHFHPDSVRTGCATRSFSGRTGIRRNFRAGGAYDHANRCCDAELNRPICRHFDSIWIVSARLAL